MRYIIEAGGLRETGIASANSEEKALRNRFAINPGINFEGGHTQLRSPGWIYVTGAIGRYSLQSLFHCGSTEKWECTMNSREEDIEILVAQFGRGQLERLTNSGDPS